ncbi:MAG: GNAT family N-acetyltransferase [Gemmatimonadales bacterium]
MANQDVSIRVLERKDAPVVAKLLHELLHELAKEDGPSLATLQRTAEDVLGSDSIDGVLAFVEDEPVGVIMLNECMAIYAGGRFGEITELYVSPEYRSKGIAPMLIGAAEKIGHQKGWKRLEVGAPDQPAWNRTQRLYFLEGFEEVGPRMRKII